MAKKKRSRRQRQSREKKKTSKGKAMKGRRLYNCKIRRRAFEASFGAMEALSTWRRQIWISNPVDGKKEKEKKKVVDRRERRKFTPPFRLAHSFSDARPCLTSFDVKSLPFYYLLPETCFSTLVLYYHFSADLTKSQCCAAFFRKISRQRSFADARYSLPTVSVLPVY